MYVDAVRGVSVGRDADGAHKCPVYFQRMMEWVLQEHENADPYIDDVIVGSTGDTPEEVFANHERDVRQVLQTLARHNILVSPKKVQMFMMEVEFCGHILSEGRRCPAPGKLLAVQKWELPTTVTQLRGFLGLTNYYSGYVKDYAKMAGPLTSKLQLSREDGKRGSQKVLKWSAIEIAAFNELKKALVGKLELYQVQPDKPFVMKVDASRFACGAVLEQENNREMRPVAFLVENSR